MNVNVLEQNPSWLWYPAIAVPILGSALIVWLLFKYIPVRGPFCLNDEGLEMLIKRIRALAGWYLDRAKSWNLDREKYRSPHRSETHWITWKAPFNVAISTG